MDLSTQDKFLCHHCGISCCQVDFIHSWISRYSSDNKESYVINERIEELISKRLPSLIPTNICEERLLNWYNLMKRRQSDLISSNTSFQIKLSSLLFSFSTQNRAGFYQLYSNGHQILVDDCCQINGYSQSIRCLRLYNQIEEEYQFELPQLKQITLSDSIQNITWNQFYKIFIFITQQKIYQCDSKNRIINEITEYKIPSIKHSLSLITSNEYSSIFLAYEYPSVIIDLWNISESGLWIFKKQWTSFQLFPILEQDDEFEEESYVYGISSMRYLNETLHLLTRHERHWCLHLMSIIIDNENQNLIPQRRIDLSLDYLRFAGENFQMEILPNQQGWLFAIRREYLIYLAFNGQDITKIFLPSSKNSTDLIYNICIMNEENLEQDKNIPYLVIRNIRSIRFYQLFFLNVK